MNEDRCVICEEIIPEGFMIVSIAWCHHPEGIIKYYKNRRKKK